MHLSDDRLFGLHERDPDIEREKKSEQNGNSFYRVQDGLDRKNVKKRRKLFQNTSQKPRKFAYKEALQQALYAMFLGANAPV